jgi:hypothetical protein
MVENLPHYLKVQGSSPAALGMGRERGKSRKLLFLHFLLLRINREGWTQNLDLGIMRWVFCQSSTAAG